VHRAEQWRQIGVSRNRYEAIAIARSLRAAGEDVSVMRIGQMPRAKCARP
jgi:hypothetical protein